MWWFDLQLTIVAPGVARPTAFSKSGLKRISWFRELKTESACGSCRLKLGGSLLRKIQNNMTWLKWLTWCIEIQKPPISSLLQAQSKLYCIPRPELLVMCTPMNLPPEWCIALQPWSCLRLSFALLGPALGWWQCRAFPWSLGRWGSFPLRTRWPLSFPFALGSFLHGFRRRTGHRRFGTISDWAGLHWNWRWRTWKKWRRALGWKSRWTFCLPLSLRRTGHRRFGTISDWAGLHWNWRWRTRKKWRRALGWKSRWTFCLPLSLRRTGHRRFGTISDWAGLHWNWRWRTWKKRGRALGWRKSRWTFCLPLSLRCTEHRRFGTISDWAGLHWNWRWRTWKKCRRALGWQKSRWTFCLPLSLRCTEHRRFGTISDWAGLHWNRRWRTRKRQRRALGWRKSWCIHLRDHGWPCKSKTIAAANAKQGALLWELWRFHKYCFNGYKGRKLGFFASQELCKIACWSGWGHDIPAVSASTRSRSNKLLASQKKPEVYFIFVFFLCFGIFF